MLPRTLRRGIAIATTLVVSAKAHANPPDTFGFGSRETAMGGAAAAETRGFAANYYNPAALVRARGIELGLGYFRADHSLAMNDQDNHVDPVKGWSGGIVAPGRVLGIPFAFGVGAHLPDDRISRVRGLRQEQPRWELYDNRNQRLFLATNLAIEPVPWLAVGAGLSFMSSTRGRLAIGGGVNAFRPDDSQLRHEVDADLTAVRYPQAGMRMKLGESVALAVVYRGEFQLALDLDAHLFGDLSGLTTARYDISTRSVNNFLPQQAVIGGSWALGPNVRTTFDMTWIDWSAYVAPVARLDATLDIPPPAAGWPASIAPPEAPAKARIEPLKLRDRVVPRVGVEWHAIGEGRAKGFFRAGYEAAKSPISPQTGVTNYVDRDRHTGSFGIGASFDDPLPELPGTLSVDAHIQLSALVTETTRKASSADVVGDYTAGGHILNFGLTAGFAFGRRGSDDRGRR